MSKGIFSKHPESMTVYVIVDEHGNYFPEQRGSRVFVELSKAAFYHSYEQALKAVSEIDNTKYNPSNKMLVIRAARYDCMNGELSFF